MRRSRAALSGLLAVLATVALVGSVAIAVSAQDRVPEPPQPGAPSYELTAFELQYPFLKEGPDGRVDELTDAAGVAFTSTWTTTYYPGEASCIVEILDAAGEVVGQREFGLDTEVPTASFAPRMPVAVIGSPARPRGYCGEAPQYSGEGVTFTEVAIVQQPGPTGVYLVMRAHWLDGLRPPVQECAATLQLPDGATDSVTFQLQPADGARYELILGPMFSEASEPRILCERFLG